MKSLKQKHKTDYSVSIADFLKTKGIPYEKPKTTKCKSQSIPKRQLSNSKSTAQCHKLSYLDNNMSMVGLYTSTGKHSFIRLSDTMADSLNRNRTLTNMMVQKPKGDDELISERPNKYDGNDNEKENNPDYTKYIKEIKNLKESHSKYDTFKKYMETICMGSDTQLANLLKEIALIYDAHIVNLTEENAKLKENICLNSNKQADFELEKSKLLWEIKMQQKHIDAQTVAMSKMQESSKRSVIHSKTIKMEECAHVKKAVPSLDLSKIKKNDTKLNLVIKPSLIHHSLSSDSEDSQNDLSLIHI